MKPHSRGVHGEPQLTWTSALTGGWDGKNRNEITEPPAFLMTDAATGYAVLALQSQRK
ncbi:MAG: hypothetical protein ACJ746_03960 [Bryobacteraceae bacterium]